jgi:hypothetical protein
MGQPRRNEKRFYRYPLHRIVAVIDDAPNLGLTLADLGSAGLLHFRRWTIEEFR